MPGRRSIEAWYDSPYALPVLLGVFVVAWTAFQAVAFATVDLHPDVLEVYAWGRHPAAGYYKHPPLGALMAGAWFSVFPARDWAAHLMAMANAALSIYVIDLIARRFLTGDKRLIVALLLMLTPFYQFHAVRFGSNQTLLPTWPLAVYCFVQSYERRTAIWGAAAGAAAALAMLGKYYSLFLIGGLVVAALLHPARARYMRSAAPWTSIAAGFALLAPHLAWLMRTGYQPLDYAYAVHGATSPLQALATIPGYVAGAIGYVAAALIVYCVALRPRASDVLAALWPRDPDRRMLAVLFLAPLLLPPLSAAMLNVELASLWTMEAWFLLPVLLLLPASITVTRRAAVDIAALVAAVTLGAVGFSPALAWLKHTTGTKEGRAYYSPLARELTARWRTLTGQPLTIVMGDVDVAQAMPFYASDHPDVVPGFRLDASPWVSRARVTHEGYAAICRDSGCVQQAMRLSGDRAGTTQENVEVIRTVLGNATAPARFILVLVPPNR